ncbi:MAG: hypothetical protein M1823_000543 [Watsoniomyces obsoletus]|nr:MAG: hypothetical protein M1823_000543 [Watsoniomyces obsoletus]
MSNPNEIPWSDPEKLFLLTEILKDARISHDFLLSIIVDLKIEPRWTEIPLPPGRSVRSCQNAFQTLLNTSAATTLMPFGQPGQPGLTGMVPPPSGRKRALPAKDPATPGNRALQPRPTAFATLNGDQSVLMQPSPGDGDAIQPPKKKRGRPSRAEVEARAAAAAARGEVYPPVKSPRTPKPAARPAERRSLAGHEDLSHLAGMGTMVGVPGAATTPAGVSTVLTPGSTGKRRRGRPTKAEAEAKRVIAEAGLVPPHDGPATMGPPDHHMDDPGDVTRLVGGPDVTGGPGPTGEVGMPSSMEQSSGTL